MAVGPEGGWTAAEIDAAGAGAESWIGRRVVATAAWMSTVSPGSNRPRSCSPRYARWKGKKRMKQIGRVEVPQEAFVAALTLDD